MRGLILSAGLGERLRPITLKQAKPAVEFLNMPMLAYPYHWLSTLGLTDVVFNTHYLPETVRHAAMHVVKPEVRMHIAFEPEILGSGGGIWNARFDLMGDKNFIVANGDGVVLSPKPGLLKEMLEFHDWENALATLLVCPLDGVGVTIPGVWHDRNNRVTHFGKESRGQTQCHHFASYMIFSDRIWDLLPAGSSNILYDVLEPLIAKGEKVMAFQADDLKWFETGNVKDYLGATRFCLEQLRDQTPLGQCALNILDHVGPTFRMRSDFKNMHLIADSAEVCQDVLLEGMIVIGRDNVLPPKCRLKDCVVLSGSAIAPGADHQNEILF